MCDPSAVVGIRFMSFARLDLLCICQDDDDCTFEDIEHRLPICAGTLHCHMRTPSGLQPFLKSFQFRYAGAEPPNFGSWLAIGWSNHDTGHEKRLANVDASASFQNCVNHDSPRCGRGADDFHATCSTGSK